MPRPQRCYSLIQTTEEVCTQILFSTIIIIIFSTNNITSDGGYEARFIRYSEKCTGCCSPTFGSTSIIGDQQAGRGGGRDESGRRYYLADDSRSFSSLRGYRGLLQQDYSHQFRSSARRPCVQQIETRVRLRILDPFISAPAAHCWLITGPARDNGSNIPVSSLPRLSLQSSHRRARAEQCK